VTREPANPYTPFLLLVSLQQHENLVKIHNLQRGHNKNNSSTVIFVNTISLQLIDCIALEYKFRAEALEKITFDEKC
jgi:hypothetical protein